MSEHHFWYDLRQRKKIGLEAFNKKKLIAIIPVAEHDGIWQFYRSKGISYIFHRNVSQTFCCCCLFVYLFVCLLMLLLQAIFTNKMILITYIANMLRIKHDLLLRKKDNRDMKRVSLHPIMVDYQSAYGSVAQTLSNILRISDKRLFCLFVFLVLSHRCAIVIINQIKVKVNWNN